MPHQQVLLQQGLANGSHASLLMAAGAAQMLLDIAHERDEDIPALIYEARGVRLRCESKQLTSAACPIQQRAACRHPCSATSSSAACVSWILVHILTRGIGTAVDIPAVQPPPAPHL